MSLDMQCDRPATAPLPEAGLATPMMPAAVLQLLRLVSPSLPIGGFAYSQGLEYAIESQWLNTDEALQDWLQGVLHQGLGRTDLPVLLRYYRALEQGDFEALEHWNQWLRATRESQELLFEDEQLGLALKRLLLSLQLIERDTPLPDSPGYSCLFAIAAYRFQIPAQSAALGFAWSWLENQISVACKTIPLGQTAAQQLICRLLPELVRCVDQAGRLDDGALGSTLPGFGLASALHESQYSRLFRS